MTNGVKIVNKRQDGLLKTIKVPTDLKKLNDALPESKYGNQSSLIGGKNSKSNNRDSSFIIEQLVS